MADGVGIVPAIFKTAFITPHLKKPDLDVTDVRSFRPISNLWLIDWLNLSVISKLLERLVAKPGIRLSSVALGFCPTSFEVTAARATVRDEIYTVIVIYRPGSDAVRSSFFDELSELLDRAKASGRHTS